MSKNCKHCKNGWLDNRFGQDVECFSPLPKYWFWRFRLNRLVRKGVLQRRYFGSFWPSCARLPSYGIALLRAKEVA